MPVAQASAVIKVVLGPLRTGGPCFTVEIHVERLAAWADHMGRPPGGLSRIVSAGAETAGDPA